ncbi:MAG: GTPase ObgE [Chitinophagales bacterium]
MAGANFIDYVKIFTASGDGGAGSSHFRREKYIPKGGPDGGDGGRGGHVILRGNKQMWTLLHLRYNRHFKAAHGAGGSGQRSSGSDGDDIIIDVPLGTVIRDEETQEILFEITEHEEEYFLRQGGKGGQGNWHFKTSVRQAPTYAQPGLEGEEGWTILELKVLADVGLVGFPNAGKSTLQSTITASKPKIANYAFTTLKPNLGIVSYRDDQSFVMADIPGIIEGAAEGKGLGHRFLRHIERNSCLLFMVAADSENITNEYRVLLKELTKYNPELLIKDRILAISKADMIDDELQEMLLEELTELKEEVDIIFISSITGKNISQLKDKLWQMLNA